MNSNDSEPGGQPMSAKPLPAKSAPSLTTVVLLVAVIVLLGVAYVQWLHIDMLQTQVEKQQLVAKALQKELAAVAGGGP